MLLQKLVKEQNTYLKLVEERKTKRGRRYRDFELLVDAPWVPTDELDIDPPHAVAGDWLRENPGDKLTPFELLRDGIEVGNLEWWAVSSLFDGLLGNDTATPVVEAPREGLLTEAEIILRDSKRTISGWRFNRDVTTALYKIEEDAWIAEHYLPSGHRGETWTVWMPNGDDTRIGVPLLARFGKACVALDHVERDAVYDRGRRLAGRLERPAAYVEESAGSVQPGDIIVRGSKPPTVGTVAPLSLDDYEALRVVQDDPERTALTELDPLRHMGFSSVCGFIGRRQGWGRRRKVWTPELWRVRFPPRSTVSQPIEATGDDAALFELLCQVGGRMPANA